MLRSPACYLFIVATCLLLDQTLVAQEQAPKKISEMSIADIMKDFHKKPAQAPSSLIKKVATGSASDQEKQQLVDAYKRLRALQPSKGDAESWNEKTELLISAATAALENKAEAQQMLTKASNCKACHDAHKE
jgi:hypothetical protein